MNQKSSKTNGNTKDFRLFLPFTAQAISLSEENVPLFHNFSLYNAFRYIEKCTRWKITCAYFTERLRKYEIVHRDQKYIFYPLYFRWRASSKRYRRQWSLKALVELILSPPDAVGLFTTFGGFAMAVARLCKIRQIPYMVFVQSQNIPSTDTQAWFLRTARSVLIPTKGLMSDLLKRPELQSVRFYPLSVFPDVRLFAPSQSKNSLANAPRFTFIGRVLPSKGVHDVIDVFAFVKSEYPNATLTIAGPLVDQDYFKQLTVRLEKHGIINAVRFLGSIAPEQVAQVLENSDLFIFPSRAEVQPFVVLESMAAGVPVVALRGTGGHERFISHRVNGLLVDLPEMGTEILRLLRAPQELRRMSEAARSVVMHRYNIESTVAQLETAFECLDNC